MKKMNFRWSNALPFSLCTMFETDDGQFLQQPVFRCSYCE